MAGRVPALTTHSKTPAPARGSRAAWEAPARQHSRPARVGSSSAGQVAMSTAVTANGGERVRAPPSMQAAGWLPACCQAHRPAQQAARGLRRICCHGQLSSPVALCSPATSQHAAQPNSTACLAQQRQRVVPRVSAAVVAHWLAESVAEGGATDATCGTLQAGRCGTQDRSAGRVLKR